jgi:hypothetical protein
MADIVIQQAIYGAQSSGGDRILARSAGFRDEWLPHVERLCASFGERPAGVRCPGGVLAQPFDSRVAVIQVADLGPNDSGRPWMLGFHLLVLTRADYAKLGGDPFELAQQFPPPWEARGELPALSVPARFPQRTVHEVREALQRGDQSPVLLGAAQALVDGGRLVFQRSAPDTQLLRDLWTILPTSNRCNLWPASFAFGAAPGFDVLVVPDASGPEYARYLTERQAGDYPEGHYELNLQIAAEAGDQRELDALFARRSRSEIWRMGLVLLGLVSVLVVVGNLLPVPAAREEQASPPSRIDLPSARQFTALSKRDRQSLTQALREAAVQAGVHPLPDPPTAERLIIALSQQLGKPESGRDPGKNLTTGPPERRLRALLWTYDVAEYHDLDKKPVELVQCLRQKVIDNKTKEKDSRER